MARARTNRKIKTFDETPMQLPTLEAQRHHEFRATSIKEEGTAKQPRAVMRKVVMVDKLYDEGKITKKQNDAAAKYLGYFNRQDYSLVIDSLGNLQPRGSASPDGATIAYLDAKREVRDAKAAVGSVLDVFQLIVEKDYSISKAAMELHGARDYIENGKFILKPREWAKVRVIEDLDVALDRLVSHFRL